MRFWVRNEECLSHKESNMKSEILNFETANGDTTAVVRRPDIEAESAVVLIHEWWGITDHVRDIAGRYAKEGYLCVAPDLFRGKLAKNADEASKLMHDLALDDAMDTISSAIAEIEHSFAVDQIGITGYCMGGTFALRAACELEELAAAAPFYGDIPEEDVLARLTVPTLFIAGSRDKWITPEKVAGLKEAAQKNDLPVEVVSYDADHAFFNDTRPEVYDAKAATDAWRRVLAHFRKYLTVAEGSAT
jgi:carboxymethylenebutenolidase